MFNYKNKYKELLNEYNELMDEYEGHLIEWRKHYDLLIKKQRHFQWKFFPKRIL